MQYNIELTEGLMCRDKIIAVPPNLTLSLSFSTAVAQLQIPRQQQLGSPTSRRFPRHDGVNIIVFIATSVLLRCISADRSA